MQTFSKISLIAVSLDAPTRVASDCERRAIRTPLNESNTRRARISRFQQSGLSQANPTLFPNGCRTLRARRLVRTVRGLSARGAAQSNDRRPQ